MPVRLSVLLSVALCLAAPVSAQNLLVNGGFDTNVLSWTPELSAVTVWDPLDWAANPASGSMRVTNPQAAASMPVVVSQCVALPPANPYEVGTRVRFPSGQAASGTAVIRTFFFDNATCTFPAFGGVVPPAVPSTTTDTWVDTFVTNVVPSPGAFSTLVTLYVVKNEPGGTLSALFDRVVFGPAGTTPVDLQSFSVE